MNRINCRHVITNCSMASDWLQDQMEHSPSGHAPTKLCLRRIETQTNRLHPWVCCQLCRIKLSCKSPVVVLRLDCIKCEAVNGPRSNEMWSRVSWWYDECQHLVETAEVRWLIFAAPRILILQQETTHHCTRHTEFYHWGRTSTTGKRSIEDISNRYRIMSWSTQSKCTW